MKQEESTKPVLSAVDVWEHLGKSFRTVNLSRIHRTLIDRLLSQMGIPIRRYICRDCRWRGVRIDEKRI